MTASKVRFPEYGDGGNCLGCRRARRAFRFAVAACVFITWMLWFAENFLRYEQTERLYLRGLTLEPEAARPFLRQAVKLDEAAPDVSTPKYLQALAEREEDDLVLETYESAFKLDPNNAQLAMRYGCRLMAEGRPAEARDRFRDAARNDPDNVLPVYLEASVLPWVEDEDPDLRKSLALIAKANSSGKRVSMPRPLWSSSLPQGGTWYARLRRQIVREVCYPLLHYADFVTREAEKSIARNNIQYWDSWLEKLQGMGHRLVVDAVPEPATQASQTGAALQALTGLEIQLKAIDQREAVHAAEGLTPDETLSERKSGLKAAQGRLEAFERQRPEFLARMKRRHGVLTRLISEAMLVLALVYGLAYLLTKLFRVKEERWTVPHGQVGRRTLYVGVLCIFLFLSIAVTLQRMESVSLAWIPIAETSWSVLLAALVLYGFFYPLSTLPSPKQVAQSRGNPEGFETIRTAARKDYRAAYLVLLRRYYGIAIGVMGLAACSWVLFHRVLFSLYPWQIGLMETGLGKKEAQLVAEILQSIQ